MNVVHNLFYFEIKIMSLVNESISYVCNTVVTRLIMCARMDSGITLHKY